jgi:hypothetical protein
MGEPLNCPRGYSARNTPERMFLAPLVREASYSGDPASWNKGTNRVNIEE